MPLVSLREGAKCAWFSLFLAALYFGDRMLLPDPEVSHDFAEGSWEAVSAETPLAASIFVVLMLRAPRLVVAFHTLSHLFAATGLFASWLPVSALSCAVVEATVGAAELVLRVLKVGQPKWLRTALGARHAL